MKNNGSKFVGCLMLFSGHIAAMPYTFTAGDAAIADEVNANFTFLEKKSTIDSNRITVLEGPNTNCPSSNNQLTFTYNQKVGLIGQEFMVGVESYILKKLPFVDMATGNKYVITTPWPRYGNLPFITKWAEDYSLFCSVGTISGFPFRSNALIFERQMRIFSPNDVRDMKSKLSAKVEILVGQTIVTIDFYGYTWETGIDTPIFTPNDYTNPIRFTEMAAPTRMLGELDDLIDYVIIEKVP